MRRRETGILGEKLAQDFLKQRGYQIVETNYRCPEGEIDIVARQGDCLVFVEVRAKTGSQFGSPEESITPAKMAKMRATAAYYQQAHDCSLPSWRIDVVAVELNHRREVVRLEHIENAVGEA